MKVIWKINTSNTSDEISAWLLILSTNNGKNFHLIEVVNELFVQTGGIMLLSATQWLPINNSQ